MTETQHTIMLLRTTVMLSRKQIAEELHVTYNTVGRWERGEFDMHPVFIKYLIMRYKLDDESASSADDTTQLGELVSEPVAEPQLSDTTQLRELVSEPIPIKRRSGISLADVCADAEKMFANLPN